jgi:16S rRNA (uracil1498-N3)-methyltransferase
MSRIVRIFYEGDLNSGAKILLPVEQSRHVLRVLRLRINGFLIIFNGQGGEYSAQLTGIDNNQAHLLLGQQEFPVQDASLKVELAQAVSRAEKMEWAIQKAVELGVTQITPVITQRCVVKLSEASLAKRMRRWQAIVISACEQSGRCDIPVVNTAKRLEEWLPQAMFSLKLLAYPGDKAKPLADYPDTVEDISLAIGPEGGFTPAEYELAQAHNFQSLALGPRILRTETAPVVALTLLQARWGDINYDGMAR